MSPDFKVTKTAAVKKRRTTKAKPKPAAPVVLKVDPAVMAKARELAGGDHARLMIKSSTEVVVLNRPRGERR